MTVDPETRRRRHKLWVFVVIVAVSLFLATRGLPVGITLAVVAFLAAAGWLSVRNTRYCPRCGHVMPFGPHTPTVARFCPRCGTPVGS